MTLDHTRDTNKIDTAKLICCFILLIIIVILSFNIINKRQPTVFTLQFRYKANYFKTPDFTDYDFETDGRKKYAWDTTEEGLGAICHFWNECAGWIDKQPKRVVAKALAAWESWIFAYLSALEESPLMTDGFVGFPWGDNWYQFSIDSTRTLAYYIVSNKSSGVTSIFAAKSILYIIKNPQLSLGYARDKANSAMMVFPWSLANAIMGYLYKNTPEFAYAVDQYDIRPRTDIRCNEDGVHLDYAYLTHGGVYAFGYLDSIYDFYPDTAQVIPEVKEKMLDYHIDNINFILKHPTIPLSGSTLYHRRPDVGMALYTGKKTGSPVQVMPSMKYMRYFTPNWQWSQRAGQATIAYYESDQNVNNMACYSCMMAAPFWKGETDNSPKFPRLGFITPTGTTELPTVENTNTTTTPHFAEYNDTTRCYVFTDHENYAVCLQYRISYKPIMPDPKALTTCIDIKAQTAKIYMGTLREGEQYCADDKTNMTLADFGDDHIVTTINFPTRSITATTFTGYMPSLEKMTNNMYHELIPDANNGSTIIMNGAGQAVYYCPAETDYMTESMTIPAGGKVYTFEFDSVGNQMVCTTPNGS